MPLYNVTVSQVVRDLIGATIEVEAETKEEAERLALEKHGEGEFALDFFDGIDSEPPEAIARLLKEA
jgi:hypothetical protein